MEPMSKKDIRRKRIQRERQRRRSLLRFFLITVIVFAFILFIFNTKLFGLKHIKVIGNKNLSQDEIVKASELEIGENILKQSLTEAKAKIKANPYVEDAHLSRSSKDTVTIEVKERMIAAEFFSDSKYIYIDEKGTVLENSNSYKEGYPLIKNFDKTHLEQGENFYNTEVGASLEELITEISSNNLVKEIKTIEKNADLEVSMNYRSGLVVQLGELKDVRYKMKVLNELMKKFKDKGQVPKMIMFNKGKAPVVVLDTGE